MLAGVGLPHAAKLREVVRALEHLGQRWGGARAWHFAQARMVQQAGGNCPLEGNCQQAPPTSVVSKSRRLAEERGHEWVFKLGAIFFLQ